MCRQRIGHIGGENVDDGLAQISDNGFYSRTTRSNTPPVGAFIRASGDANCCMLAKTVKIEVAPSLQAAPRHLQTLRRVPTGRTSQGRWIS
jgi:hypothetical protein